MTSLLKNVALLAVVAVGSLGLSSQPANAIEVSPPISPTGNPVVTAPPKTVQVPEPGAIAPLALLGAALLLKRRTSDG